jgi:hypothetical protein
MQRNKGQSKKNHRKGNHRRIAKRSSHDLRRRLAGREFTRNDSDKRTKSSHDEPGAVQGWPKNSK